MSHAVPPPPPPPPPQPPSLPPTPAATQPGSKPTSTTAVTVVVIVTVVILQVLFAVIGFVLPFFFGGIGLDTAIITVVNITMSLIPHAVVAGGAALIARTPTGRALGIVLPMLAWLLYSAFWFGLVQQAHFYNPVVSGLVGPLLMVLVLAGWGCAAWSGRRWLIGLPITLLLLIAVQWPLSYTLAPALAVRDAATAQILLIVSTIATTATLVFGGVVCWLLDQSEQGAGK